MKFQECQIRLKRKGGKEKGGKREREASALRKSCVGGAPQKSANWEMKGVRLGRLP